MSTSTRGIIYIVTGQKFLEEACRSAASVKRCMPDIPITILSDVPVRSPLFEQVVRIANPTHGPEDKIRYLAHSPYEETLYLDSDTYMTEDSREVFALLERFDLAAVHAPYRVQYRVCEVPDCFPELNSGVIAFRKSEAVRLCLDQWLQIYRSDQRKSVDWLFSGGAAWYRRALPNQPSFRRAVYESGLRITVLPPEYNCRIPFPGFVHAKVKIIHGRSERFSALANELNKTLRPRVHIMRWGKLRVMESAMPPGDHVLMRIRWSLHHCGLLQTVRAAMTQVVARIFPYSA